MSGNDMNDTTITTNFVRSEEQSLLAKTVADLAGSTLGSDHVREVMEAGAISVPGWQSLAELGLLGLLVDEADGGAGAGPVEAGIVAEALGAVVAPVPFVTSAVLATVAIREAAGDDQRAELLAPLVEGRELATVLLGSRVECTADGDGWRLVGTAGRVAFAPTSTTFVVPASTEDGDVHVFVLPADHPGLEVEVLPALDQTQPLGDVTLDATVDAATRLTGEDAEGALDLAILTAAAVQAMEQVGGAARIHALGVDYARTRFQFGRAIGSFQAVKHPLAETLVDLEAMRTLAWHAVSAMADDPEGEGPLAVSMAKSWCSEKYESIAATILQVHGGIGFTWESDVHLFLKRARASRVLLGTPRTWRARLSSLVTLD